MKWRYQIAKWVYPEIFELCERVTSITQLEAEVRKARLAAIQLQSLNSNVNLRRSKKRPRTKFKKR